MAVGDDEFHVLVARSPRRHLQFKADRLCPRLERDIEGQELLPRALPDAQPAGPFILDLLAVHEDVKLELLVRGLLALEPPEGVVADQDVAGEPPRPRRHRIVDPVIHVAGTDPETDAGHEEALAGKQIGSGAGIGLAVCQLESFGGQGGDDFPRLRPEPLGVVSGLVGSGVDHAGPRPPLVALRVGPRAVFRPGGGQGDQRHGEGRRRLGEARPGGREGRENDRHAAQSGRAYTTRS